MSIHVPLDAAGVSPSRVSALRAEAEALYLGTRPKTRAAAGAAAGAPKV